MDEEDQSREAGFIGQRTGGKDRLDDLSNKKCEGNYMDLDEYQKLACQTDQYPSDGPRGESISLFGLIGEIGSLLTTFKKRLRDKDAYRSFHADLREEMGDVLWYLANLSKKYHLSLNEIAQFNLEKTSHLWGASNLGTETYDLYDANHPYLEQLPRKLTVTFIETEEESDAGYRRLKVYVDDKHIGDPLTDNAYIDDGYRYHDCFHLAYAAILGWSPVLRQLLIRKRKSNPEIDEVEDGARAKFTEEFISLYVYNYARDHNYLDGTSHIDTEILRIIKSLVRGFEVENRSAFEWRSAILNGFELFRQLRANNGGIVEIDLNSRTCCYRKPQL